MTSRDFAYWLQGFFEITGTNKIDEGQAEMIKRHLNLVFKHEIDPSMGDKEHQQKLNQIHNIGNPQTEQEAIEEFGPPPFEGAKWNFHGWEDKFGGLARC